VSRALTPPATPVVGMPRPERPSGAWSGSAGHPAAGTYPHGVSGRALNGMRCSWGTALTALLCAWSGVWLAVWLLAVTAVLGALLGFIGAALTGGTLSLGGGVLSVAGGAIAGVAEALVGSLRALVVAEPLQLLVSIAGGLAIALALLAAAAALEPGLLRLRGCRRLSRREQARLLPLLESAARDLGLRELPGILIADGGSLRVQVHTRHLVIGRGLLEELGDDHAATRLWPPCSATGCTTGRPEMA